MGFKDFLIIMDGPLRTDPKSFVHDVLGLREHVPDATMDYGDLMRNDECVAIAERAGQTLIWWMDAAYDVLGPEPSKIEAALGRWNPDFNLTALAVYDVSNFYGFARVEAGKKVRCRSGSLDGVHSDHGEPLAEELAFFRPSAAVGEGGLPLYEHEDELWEHHQIGGEFVHQLGRRFLGGALHTSELAGFWEMAWSVFRTPAQLEEYRARLEDERKRELGRIHDRFEMDALAEHYGVSAKRLRKKFRRCLCERAKALLGDNFELRALEGEDGNVQLYSFFKVVRLMLFGDRRIPLRLARTLDPTIEWGQEMGLRLGYRGFDQDEFPSIMRSLEAQNLSSDLVALVQCHENGTLNEAAKAALEDALDELRGGAKAEA